MIDILGNKLKIGDEVVFVLKDSLLIGNITKFYKGHFDDFECSVNSYTHIKSFRIMKLEIEKEV